MVWTIMMFKIFTDFADWLTCLTFGLSPDGKLGDAVHFFIEDVSKICALLLVVIHVIALSRASA
jgi:hypothetical protein